MALDNVSKLFQHAHRNNCTVRREEESRGPDHLKTFFIRAVIDGKAYPRGEGRTKKEAKQDAARIALNDILHPSSGDQSRSPVDMTPVESMDAEDGGPPEEPPQESEETSPPNSSVSRSDSIVFMDISNSPRKRRAGPAAGSAPEMRQKPGDRKKGKNAKARAAEQQDSAKWKRKSHGPREASRFITEFGDIRFLARGGFGVVYKARHKKDNELYAVKISLSDKDALREVRALAKLHHPHIIRYHSCWEEDEGYTCNKHGGMVPPEGSVNFSEKRFLYIKMELGMEVLSDWIQKKNAETLTDFERAEKCLPIFLQIVKGVECIHSNEKIHRDLKPTNILRGQDGLMKIADFGLVTKNDDSERTRNRGTETYMAPEQKRKKKYDHKVDMFPLGLILLEMIHAMSTDHERGKVLRDARKQKLPKDCSLFKELQLVRRLLSPDPKDRPEARDVRAEVEGWIQENPRRNVTV